jgi:ABC-type antimicrobial peptide transport system permease subunit
MNYRSIFLFTLLGGAAALVLGFWLNYYFPESFGLIVFLPTLLTAICVTIYLVISKKSLKRVKKLWRTALDFILGI